MGVEGRVFLWVQRSEWGKRGAVARRNSFHNLASVYETKLKAKKSQLASKKPNLSSKKKQLASKKKFNIETSHHAMHVGLPSKGLCHKDLTSKGLGSQNEKVGSGRAGFFAGAEVGVE